MTPMNALVLAGVLMVGSGCVAPVKYYADIQVYDSVRTGILHQIDGAKCKHIGFLLTDTPRRKDFEIKLRCSLVEVP